MTQPPSPSAAALKPCPFCGEEVQRRDALWPSEGDQDGIIHVKPTDCPMQIFSDGTWGGSLYGRWNGGIDATIERAVAAERSKHEKYNALIAEAAELIETSTNLGGTGKSLDELRAERAKPAASDHEIAVEIAKFAKETVFVFDNDLARIAKRIAAALVERGERERERAAKIAEGCWGDRCDVAAEIRNQTTNDEA